jgi:homopolymeric O-antigen transport system ATP-binding protein
MDHDTAIRIDGLGKRYRLGEYTRRGQTLGEKIMALPRGLTRRARDGARHIVRGKTPWEDSETPPGTFWALRDIDLEIKRGQAVGIIGRNGAGKSTLLKILSRITVPTKGRMQIRGRVSSLLEIGTGFHEQLTGRENIYLNGSILGMRKVEIDRQFDAIVDFAGVDKFLDTPVKRYSSGMRIRLGFAVAAHLDPEILIVDEVLAVGDAEFQKKCLGKMGDVATEGRTVLFVSHNLQAVKHLCNRGVLLKDGQIQMAGGASEVVEGYLNAVQDRGVITDIPRDMHLKYPPGLEVHRFELLNSDGEPTNEVCRDEDFTIRLAYKVNDPAKRYHLRLAIRTADGLLAGTVSSRDGLDSLTTDEKGCGRLEVCIPNLLNGGRYSFEIKVKAGLQLVDYIEGLPFSVAEVSILAAQPAQTGLLNLRAAWKLLP